MLSKLQYNFIRWRYREKSLHSVLSNLYSFSFPQTNISLLDTKFTVIDCEMSGLNVNENELLSIGWTTIENGKINNAHSNHILVQSKKGSGDSILIHGLSDKDLAGATNIARALGLLVKQLAGSVAVFHFSAIDLAFLQRASFQCFHCPLLFTYVDTMLIEKRRMARSGKVGGLRLHECRARYNLEEGTQHNALADAHATAELFLAQVHHSGDIEKLHLNAFPLLSASV